MKHSVSIGIPAYNEASNILQLVNLLLAQKQTLIKITEILIYCDGSTDQTPKLLKSLTNPLIKVRVGSTRLGQQIRQNQIIKNFSGEILVIIEADILPANNQTVENLVLPLIRDKSGQTGMVVGRPFVVKPEGFLEKILFYGYQMKYRLFADWKKGNNVYACGGHSMKALSRNFTDQLKWPKDVPEDAYTYFRLKTLTLKLYTQKSALAYMKNVTNLKDRVNQVKKYLGGKKALCKFFPENFINKEYDIPKYLFIKYLLQAFFKNPFWITLYLAELIFNRVLTRGTDQFTALYQTYDSSKNLKM